jgi:flagellar basal-body rod modification protein FlgD
MPPLGNQTQEGNALRVSVETQKTQSVIVNVLDANGLLVRRLYQGSWEPGVHQVDWDGKDEMGNPVLPGDYTVIVNADGKAMSGVVTVKPNQ